MVNPERRRFGRSAAGLEGGSLDEYGSSIAHGRVLGERVARHGCPSFRFHQRDARSAKSGPRESGTVVLT